MAKTPSQKPAAPVADPAPTRSYIVRSPIKHDGTFYRVGSTIELTDDDAADLRAIITPVPSVIEAASAAIVADAQGGASAPAAPVAPVAAAPAAAAPAASAA